jgi:hypothetical protein
MRIAASSHGVEAKIFFFGSNFFFKKKSMRVPTTSCEVTMNSRCCDHESRQHKIDERKQPFNI